MIGSVANGEDAERFSDYLLTQKIDNMVEESGSGNGWTVWVEHDDDVERGKTELERFLANRNDARYGSAPTAAAKIRQEQTKAKKKRRAKFVDVRTSWGQPKSWGVPVTLTLMIASAVVSIGTRFAEPSHPWVDALRIASFSGQDDETVFKEHLKHLAEKDPSELTIRDLTPDPGLGQIARGQVWRLITPIFLHLGILHLLFNLFWVRDLGAMIESQRGTWTMLALVLLAAVLGNLAQYYWSGPWFGGLSGVNYALFGYIWIKQRFEPQLGLGVSQETVWIMMGWLLVCMTGWIGDIANAAHLMGLLCGAAFAYMPIAWRRAMREWNT